MRNETQPLRQGDVVEVGIEKGVYRGRGLARVGGQVLFVPRAHAGDRVRARVSEVHAGWAEAALEEVLEGGAGRRASPCPYVPLCGGCVYQDLGYEAQLDAKEAILRESLARAGAPWDGNVERHASPEEGWRLRAGLHFAVRDGSLAMGLRQEGTRRVVDVDHCLQLSPALNAAARGVRDALVRRADLWPRLRGLDLLESTDGTRRLASLVTTLRPHEGPRLAALAEEAPGIDGFGVETTDRRLHWLSGPAHVEMSVRGQKLRVHARSFFQSNRHLVEPLVSTVLGLLPEVPRSLDLFGGVGLFALPLAARGGGEVVTVEQSSHAAADARENVRMNGQVAVRVRCEDVGAALRHLAADGGEAIVVDPPRTGLGRDVVDLLVARRPAAIAYVSCDPATLGRDLARFAERGLRPDAVHLFDLFPDTLHLETVLRLRPR